MRSRPAALVNDDVCVDERTETVNPMSTVNGFPSSSCGNLSSLAHSEDNLTAKLQHLPLLPRPHQQQQHHQQQMTVEASNTTELYRAALLQASRCHHEVNALWSLWPSMVSPPPPPPLQLLSLYGARSWMRLVSSLMDVDMTAVFASAAIQTSTRAGSFERPQSLAVTSGQHTVRDQPSSPSTDVASTGDGVVRPHNNLTSWLPDSSGRSSDSTSVTTAVRLSATTSAPAFDAARPLLGQTQDNRRFCAGDFGCVDIHQGYVRDVVWNGVPCGRPPPTMSEAAVDVRDGGGFFCRLCLKRYATAGAVKMHARTHTLPCRCAVCGKAFSRPWLLQGHIRTHTGERPFACPFCQRAFADRSNLRAHLQTHADVKKYACTRCGKTFSRMSLLAKHKKRTACPPAAVPLC